MSIEIQFDPNGLVPVIAQDAETGTVLTLAYANREAMQRTLESGEAHYYSRSRGELWRKGETSGNTQEVVEVRVDCDGDALLYRVLPSGPACHTGEESCFFTTLAGNEVGVAIEDLETNATPTSETTGEKTDLGSMVDELAATIAQRHREMPEDSYTAKLLGDGTGRGAWPRKSVRRRSRSSWRRSETRGSPRRRRISYTICWCSWKSAVWG